MKFTVLGGSGFIGRAVVARLRLHGHDVDVPGRDISTLRGRKLGHVIYAIGLTADYRTRVFDTADAHVSVLVGLLRDATFDSWLYLSSTRVYAGMQSPVASESMALIVRPDIDGLYNLTKLTGEAICLCQPGANVRVARLSNVYGPGQGDDTFLGSIVRDAACGRVTAIGEAPGSSKDYVSIDDVCALLEAIALRGRHAVYNVASGAPTGHAELARAMASACGHTVTFVPGAPQRAFPRVDITRIASDFGFSPRPLEAELPRLIASYRSPHLNP